MQDLPLAHADRPLPTVTVVIPAHANRPELTATLEALRVSVATGWDYVVVDDGDGQVAQAVDALGGTSVRMPRSSGPAAARNRGAAVSRGDVLLFIDSDVRVRPNTIAEVQRYLAAHPEVSAVFGSYDDEPYHAGFASQFKNLAHHFVHQQSRPEASTFWAGCGAVRRDCFFAVGGFDEAYERPCIEDIEFGYRLRDAGHRIVLLHTLQVTHLKRWTVTGVLHSDLFDRGIPWVRLSLRAPSGFVGDLNLAWTQRCCVVLTWLAAGFLGLALWWPVLGTVAAVAALTVLALNAAFFSWLVRVRGLGFALAAVPLHLAYHGSNGLAVLAGAAGHLFGRQPSPRLVRHGEPHAR